MASIRGAHHVTQPAEVHVRIARAIHENSRKADNAKAVEQKAPSKAHMSATLSRLAAHDTVSGLNHNNASHLHDTVASGHPTHATGLDTVTSFARGTVAFAGSKHTAVEKVVATQSVHANGVTIHFADGSALHVAGMHHFGAGFFHH